MGIFDIDYGKDESPVDNTRITNSMLIYHSEEDMAEFKKLCKIGIKAMYGEERSTKGNISDFLLVTLRAIYDSPTKQEAAETKESNEEFINNMFK